MAGAAALAGVVAASACSAAGQVNSIWFEVSNEVNPAQSSAVVTVWASFDQQYYALYGVKFSGIAGADPGAFFDPAALLPYGPDGTVSPDGDRVDNAGPFQFHDPIGGFYADPSNPIAIWQATWATDDFTHRIVPLDLEVTFFRVVTNFYGGLTDLLDSLEVIPGEIRVNIPAPGAAWLALWLVLVARRARGSQRA